MYTASASEAVLCLSVSWFQGNTTDPLCVSLAYINHPHRSQASLSLLWLSLCYGSSLRLLYSLRIIRTKLNWTQLSGIIRHSAGRPDTWRVIKDLVLPFDAKWKKMASLSPADCCLASFTWISRPSRHCADDCEYVGNCIVSEWRLPWTAWHRVTAQEKVLQYTQASWCATFTVKIRLTLRESTLRGLIINAVFEQFARTGCNANVLQWKCARVKASLAHICCSGVCFSKALLDIYGRKLCHY